MTTRAATAHPTQQGRNGNGLTAHPAPGDVLAAAHALRHAQTFTRDQVAQLLALAYDAGRTASYAESIAEVHETWAVRRAPSTWDRAVAGRHAQMISVLRRGRAAEPPPADGWWRRGRFPGGRDPHPPLPCVDGPAMPVGADGWPLPPRRITRKAHNV